MNKITVSTLTVLLIFVLFLTTSLAQQQYIHTNTLKGHPSDVFSVVFVDNDTLISGSGDATIRAWNVNTGDQRWIRDVTYAVFAVTIPTHDSTIVAYGGAWDTNIRIRNIDDGKGRTKVRGHEATVRSLAFKPGSYHLASGSEDNTIRVWDVKDANHPQHLHTLTGHTIDIWSVTWSPDGQLLASASDDTTIRLWSLGNEVTFRELKGHQEGVWSVAFSPDGRTLASSSEDNTVRLWDVGTGEPLRVLEGHTGWVYTVAFHPDGQTLASGSYDKTIRLWNPNTGEHKATLTGHNDRVSSVAFRPDGQMLASGSYDNTVRLWNLLTVDVTGDGKVDFADIVEVAKNYGKTSATGANPHADINRDTKVDTADLVAVASAVDQQAALKNPQQPPPESLTEENIWE